VCLHAAIVCTSLFFKMSKSLRKKKQADHAIKRVPASVQLLENRLQSYDEEVREQAWKSIAKIGAPDEPLVEKCEEQLHHQNWFVREAGCNALAHCVHSGCGLLAAKAVEGHLEHDEQHIRHCAAQTLIELEKQVGVAIESMKETGLRPDNEDVIQQSSIAAATAEMLVQRLQHENPKIRKNSLDAVSRMGPLCAQHAEVICSMVTDPDLSVRNELLRVIARLDVILVDSVNLLAAALGQEEEKMRRSGYRCLMELSKTCGPQVATAVAELLKSEDKVTRIAAMECLAALGHLAGPHGKELAEHLEETDPEVRSCAVHTIISGGRSMQTHLKDIKKRTVNANADISRAAVKTLRGLAPVCSRIAKSAHKDLEEEPDLKVRMMAIEVLAGAQHHGVSHLEEVVKCLEDKDWSLRRCAIEALADLGEHAEPAGSEVARRLLHHDPAVRRAAAEALGRMGVHAGEFGHRVEGLVDTEEDSDVKQTCKAACEMLYAAGMEHHR